MIPILGTGLPVEPWFYPVKTATTGANVALSGLQTIGSVALAQDDRVLVNDQTNGANNGIWNVSAGAWSRALDANDRSQWAPGVLVVVTNGVFAGFVFRCVTPAPIVLGLTAISFALASGPNGARVQRSILSAADLPIRSTDSILNINLAAPLAISVPLYSTRGGAPLSFKDVGGNWSLNNATFNRTGADTFDNLIQIVGKTNYGRLTLMPANDGVTTGYQIQDAALT